MAWFSSEKATEPKVIHTNDRKKCWAARDAFFKCLDDNEIVDPIKDDGLARQKCNQLFQDFENACIASWVDYFKQKRVQDWKKNERIKELQAAGYQPMETSSLQVSPK